MSCFADLSVRCCAETFQSTACGFTVTQVVEGADGGVGTQVLDRITPVPAMLLRFAAKWDMPQLRSFCEGVVSLWEVCRTGQLVTSVAIQNQET
jgi:hypothetical protein